MRTAALIALGAIGVGGVHLLVRFLGRRVEDEMVKYPHGTTTNFEWLPVSSPLPSIKEAKKSLGRKLFNVPPTLSTPRFLP